MERRKFEESWKDAFDQAEFSPSDNVWTNIELDLEKTKGNHLKRRLLFYQSLAAACFIFTVSIGIYVIINTPASEQLSVKQTAMSPAKGENTSVSEMDLSKPLNEANSTAEENRINDANASLKTDSHFTFESAKTVPARIHKDQPVFEKSQPTDDTYLADHRNMLIAAEARDLDALFSPVPERKLPVLADPGKIKLQIHEQNPEPDPVALMLARLEDIERKVKGEVEEKRDKKNKGENLWTSIGFAAGSFNTINNSSTSPVRMNAPPPRSSQAPGFYSMASTAVLASQAEKEAKASGNTYSMGINVGTKISERWVVQGGVNYLAQSSNYTQQVLIYDPNNLQFRPAIYNDYRKTNLPMEDAKPNLVSTAPHDVNNDIRYLSIPMQAGYLIINRDFGLQLNAGISTDLFLQSTTTATANGEKVDPSTADYSENSVFRPVNLGGLMGTEFSYKFGGHYRIALNPGIRYPFNSIYKSDEYQTTRITFDLGLRFRYIFH